ncbi:hypothetical protein JFL43_21160 [Viridibacillus sp. YIM B01967]|uniref:Uncharacterized protein n=1 Tax=Viridibacillus soli TaxID=2798301 RepID=A0ABS1HCZ7_9BACL|nr:hypothetical protein [Viridibacillus soli]MBK3497290.1 hypothetical protein [Viridibacillus soli]
MKVAIDMKPRLQELLIHDPLFAVICDTPIEDTLYNDSYLQEIVEEKFYSTPEVASWFDISDAQLRYYIKPFQEYIFTTDEETPSTTNVIRLTFTAILKLRMIILLKDEYRVKGLKQLLGIDAEDRINPRKHHTTEPEVAMQEDLSEKVAIISNILNQMLHTGLFKFKQQENEDVAILVNNDFLTHKLNTLPNVQLAQIKVQTDQLIKENETLKDQIQELTDDKVKDVSIKLRERHLENTVVAQLRAEGLSKFSRQKKFGLFKKLFHSAEIEREKEHYIANYLSIHLYNRLETELAEYYESN